MQRCESGDAWCATPEAARASAFAARAAPPPPAGTVSPAPDARMKRRKCWVDWLTLGLIIVLVAVLNAAAPNVPAARALDCWLGENRATREDALCPIERAFRITASISQVALRWSP
jgi:hypothetical protein